jgi:TetR/AcrR family acrAB operon transcriptional repressor
MAPQLTRVTPEVRRAEILDAAARCFAEAGYAGTTVDDIAARAGVSKGAIYWHFEGGKREVFLALGDRAIEEFVQGAQALEGRGAPDECLARMFTEAGRVTREALPLVELSLEFLAHAGRDPELRDRLTREFQRVAAPIEREIARGVESGMFRPVDPACAAFAMVAALGGLKLQMLTRLELDLERAWQVAQELLLGGLRA